MTAEQRRRAASSGLTVIFGIVAAAAVIAGLTFSSTGRTLFGGERLRVQADDEGASEHAKWSGGRRGLEVWRRGEVHFQPDLGGIERLEPGGRFKLRARDGFRYRSVTIEADEAGQLTYTHHVAGLTTAWDATARRWFAGILPEAVEKTGIGAATLARDVLAREGPDALLARIERLSADRVRKACYGVLLEHARDDPAWLARLARHAARELGSDHALHGLLVTILDLHHADPDLQEAVADATRTMGSDHYRAGVLSRLAGRGATGTAFFAAVGVMHSDHHRSAVLQALRDLHASPAVCTALGGMSSDHYRTAVLLSMDRLAPGRPLLELIASMDADHYRHMALNRLLEDGIPPAGWVAFLEAARSFDGDHHRAALLTAAAPELPADPASVAAFLTTAAGLASDHHTARVVDGLLDRQDLDEESLRGLLALVRQEINSTHHRALLVEEIAGRLLQVPEHTR